MKTSPVSFGSLMVGRLYQPGHHLPLRDEISLSFPDSNGDGGHPALRSYNLDDKTYTPTRNDDGSLRDNDTPDTSIYTAHDGTVYNAFKNYALKLDDEYRKKLDLFRDNPQKVIFTEVDFYVSPRQTEKRYFLTAATNDDEAKIHNVLSQGYRYLVGRWEK